MSVKTDRVGLPGSRSLSVISAHQLFFPAAAVFAAIAPWLLLVSLAGITEPLVDVSTHARGLLIGYIGALIAGYLGGKLPPRQLVVLFGLWLAGRWAEVFSGSPLITYTLYIAFGHSLASIVVPRFSAAKKWRNRVVGPLIALVTCFPLILGVYGATGYQPPVPLYTLLLLIALLMFFMGGRLITPILARAYANTGGTLPQRVQPRLEGAVIVLLLFASAFSIFPFGTAWVALLAGLAGALVLVRLYRWKIVGPGWQDADLIALGVGYLWLGLGLLVFSLSLVERLSPFTSLHIITIGALGTLSSTVMLKFSCRTRPPPPVAYYVVVILLFLATSARCLVDALPAYRQSLLFASGLMWSVNFLLVLLRTLPAKEGQ